MPIPGLMTPIAGTAQPHVTISNFIVTDTQVGVTATASYSLTSAGVINQITTGGTSAIGYWINPAGAAGAAYEVYVTNSGDALFSGTIGSWLALNTTRTWTQQKAIGTGFKQADLTVQIRRASDGVVMDTAAITLYAEKL